MEIEILGVTKIPSADSKRLGQMDTLVTVKIDGRHTSLVAIPKDVSDPKEIERAVGDELKTRLKIVGHKFTVA